MWHQRAGVQVLSILMARTATCNCMIFQKISRGEFYVCSKILIFIHVHTGTTHWQTGDQVNTDGRPLSSKSRFNSIIHAALWHVVCSCQFCNNFIIKGINALFLTFPVKCNLKWFKSGQTWVAQCILYFDIHALRETSTFWLRFIQLTWTIYSIMKTNYKAWNRNANTHPLIISITWLLLNVWIWHWSWTFHVFSPV